MNDYKLIADNWMEENKQLTDDNIKLKARVKYLEERVYAAALALTSDVKLSRNKYIRDIRI